MVDGIVQAAQSSDFLSGLSKSRPAIRRVCGSADGPNISRRYETVRYLLMICGDENRLNVEDVPESQAAKRMQEWGQYTGELQGSGKMAGGERLRPAATATTVRLKEGQRLLSDGPFAETKEQLGGFFIVDAKDLDEAVEWASKMPHLVDGGSVEVRPVWEMGS
jgi:hypothetical protein